MHWEGGSVEEVSWRHPILRTGRPGLNAPTRAGAGPRQGEGLRWQHDLSIDRTKHCGMMV